MTNKIRCLIIDDDPSARAITKSLIAQDDRLECIGECEGSTEGALSITKNKPDLVFLDLMMPGLDGYEVLEVIEYNPKIIVVTSSEDYKSDTLSHLISGYIYKPVKNLELFKEAVDTAIKKDLN
ncbi:LytR/AlgR family response regulator transcription factor [Marinoscillum furvescens]|uniref:Response regulator receiver domain-containing protein n=1 Tax=Marinoscillum furvescens DSM 4134 TaxID=1122208 RepID=A0A3D9L205_MARFU|nr:response regulator [Marinoscillum furvescens]RED97424.1 response regulator receiver domain-containing protein [Marinoscillum furvescens DSM 4134]